MNLPFFGRNDNRKTLRIPLHDKVDHERYQKEVQSVLQTAAQQIIDSKLVWGWRKYTGEIRLMRWSIEDRKFVGFNLDDFRTFLGQQWRVFDTAGTEYLGPSKPVADRIMAVVLAHPGLPQATWELEKARQHEV